VVVCGLSGGGLRWSAVFRPTGEPLTIELHWLLAVFFAPIRVGTVRPLRRTGAFVTRHAKLWKSP